MKRAICIFGLVLMLAACASSTVLRPFTTDGCSLFPDRALIGDKDWCHCCLAHDLAYWQGGTREQRLQVDLELRDCVARVMKNSTMATTMLAGVQMGGTPYLMTPYRWAYGWGYGRNYQALNTSEQVQVDRLRNDYLKQNPCLVCRPVEVK
jgi:hypothetical protein